MVAAHNEAATIETCLSQWADGLGGGRYELVVVSNGSTDGTAAIAARELKGALRANVVELDQASKAVALRTGDDVLTCFPRVYVDADIRIDEPTLERLFATLAANPDARVAAPSLRVETEKSSWFVRRYFRVWTQLPYVVGGVIGVGVYAVNEAGKRRIGVFPDLLNDDEWVRRHFSAEETLITEGFFYAFAARNARALIRQRARVNIGNEQLRAAVSGNERVTGLRDVLVLVRGGQIGAVDAAVYVGVIASARLLALWRKKRGTANQWSMDLTSRPSLDHSPQSVRDR